MKFMPLLLPDNSWEGKKENLSEERQKNHSYLGIAGGFVHYMSGITDTLYRITTDTKENPNIIFMQDII